MELEKLGKEKKKKMQTLAGNTSRKSHGFELDSLLRW